MRCLNILFVTTKLPYPPLDGGRIAVLETIKRLSGRGHHVTLCCFSYSDDPQKVKVMEQFCNVKLIHRDTRSRLVPALLNIFSPISYTISKYRCKKMGKMISLLLTSQLFDLVHIEHLHMAHYLPIVKTYGLPVILREQNVETLLVDRFAQKVRGLQSLYARTQVAKLRRFESTACEQADLCLAITDEDEKRLRELNPRIKTAVVPAGVDIEYFNPKNRSLEEPYTIVSVASMDWLPNTDGILWFCNQVFPQIKQQLPQIKLYLVGNNPPTSIQKLADSKNIIVTGFVEDVREYIARGSVFIVPLRIGSGMRLKILQAMAMGKTVISTYIGAEGIKATHGKNVLLANNPEEFATLTLYALNNPTLRQQIGREARRLVEVYYSWDRIVDLLEDIYYALLEKHSSAL